MTAAIDWVIFEDGMLVGPDLTGRLNAINCRLRARQHVVADIADLRGEPLRKQLVLLSGSASQHHDEYSSTAQGLLEVLHSQGEAEALMAAEGIRDAKWFGNSGMVWRGVESPPVGAFAHLRAAQMSGETACSTGTGVNYSGID